MYRCICGKEFDKPNSFNAHKSHCKEHFINKYGSDKEFISLNKKRGVNAGKTLANKAKENKLIQDDKWVAEKHVCEKCGKIMTEKYGSGRFCSRACANSHIRSEESKLKTSNTIKKTILNKYPEQFILADDQLVKVKNGKSHRVCSVCGKEISLDNKSGFCLNCLRYSDECFDFRSNQSKQTRDKLRAEGRQFGFPSRNVTSYPEKFFEKVLDNNHIKYEREVKVINDHNCCYFLDFLIDVNGTKIDLEIDGEQHLKPERAESDKIRDEFLKDTYLIYRIPWNEINSEKGSLLMKDKIDRFLAFYNSL